MTKITSINLIAAVCNGNGIGYENQIPWKISEDLQYFKRQTDNCPVIMGRLTQDSLLGKPLANRTNIVISSSKDNVKEGFIYAKDIVDAIRIARLCDRYNIWVIGGQSIYEAALPYADKLYLTEIDQDATCDKFFPDFSINDFKLCCSHVQDGYCFNIYNKVKECNIYAIPSCFDRVVIDASVSVGQSRVIKAGSPSELANVTTTYYKDIEFIVKSIYKDVLTGYVIDEDGRIAEDIIVVKSHNTISVDEAKESDSDKEEEVNVEAEVKVAVKKPRKAKKCTGCKTCETKDCKNE